MNKLVPIYDEIHNVIEGDGCGAPLSVQLNITNSCYSKCIGCRKYQWPKAQLSFDKIVNIIDQLCQLGCKSIVLSGGEPTMHSRFLDICEYADRKNIEVGVLTSGIMPLKALDALSVYDYGISWMAISIDGASVEMFKITRGVDALKLVIKNIQKLKRSGIPLRCNSTISSLNIDEMPDILALCEELEIPCNFYPLHTWNELKIQTDDLEAVLRAVILCQNASVQTNAHEFVMLLNRERLHKCIIPWCHCLIDATGEVFSCCRLVNDNGEFKRNTDIVLGNVNDTSFTNIWLSERTQKIRQRLHSASESECLQCDRYHKINAEFEQWLVFSKTGTVFL